MMMSRPAPTDTKEEAPPPPTKKSSQQAVQDLERRLELLGGTTTTTAAPEVVSTDDEESEAKPTEPSLLAQSTSSTTVKGGKNALLARIMAAQERAKQAQQHHPPPTQDLLSDDPPPPIEAAPPPPVAAAEAPPPVFNAADLPPPAVQKDEPPPPFEAVQETVMEQVEASQPPPVMTPSAPAFEDLLDSSSNQPAATNSSNPLDGIEQMVQPPSDDSAVVDDVWAGLSPDERKALMEEQRKIMEAIEEEKTANAAAIAAAQAENFETRGTPAAAAPVSEESRVVHLGGDQTVALHGQERTRAAIAAGTAILVQCINCSNWMQVTENATLMYCPVCSVVSPVIKQNAVLTREEALQMTNDRKMAEQLQNEEYREANQEEEEEEESWWDSIAGVFGSKDKNVVPERAVAVTNRPLQRGEIGVSRPPGSPTLSSARTGEENDLALTEESEGLLSNSNNPAPARVAERQPLFSCVVDSVSSAASSIIGTSQTLQEDREGNIHGVDASSLLSVTRVGRENSSEQQYQALPNQDD